MNKREKVLELFKLHLGNLSDELKEKYKLTINYKVAITDYLREIGKVSVRLITFNFIYFFIKKYLYCIHYFINSI